MRKYEVSLLKSVALLIEAENETEAKEKALSEMEDYPDRDVDWDVEIIVEVDE